MLTWINARCDVAPGGAIGRFKDADPPSDRNHPDPPHPARLL
jgi:hypothetical protein